MGLGSVKKAEFCDVCGDIGCAETIITCAKCKINQEHFYCMETFRMEAPEVWLCEDCIPRNGNQSSFGKSGVTVPPNFTTSCKDHRENLQCAYPRKLNRGHGWVGWEKKVAKGRTKYISVEETLVLPQLQNVASSVKITSHSNPLSPKKHISGWVGWEKKVAKGRTKYISVEEALVLPQLQNVASSVKITSHSNPLSPKKHISSSPLSRTPLNPGTCIPKFQQPKKHPTSLGSQHLKTQSLENAKKCPSSSVQLPKTQSLENSKKHPTSSGLQHPKTQSLENSNINQVTQPKEQSSKVLNDKTVQPPAKRHIEKQQPPKAFNPIAEVKMTEKFVEKNRNDIFSSVESHSCKNIISGPMEKENIGDTKITHTIAEETTEKHTSVALACCPQVISVSDGCAATECGTSNVNLMTFSTNNKKCFSDPAQHPSWKGSFNVCDNLNFKGLQAHHPLRVHRKVCEFSMLLPEILDFKLVPRGNLWGKLFHDYCPTREDVGLYFFPSDKDSSKEYVTLLELIRDQDLMMRKQIDNVEILVLTSTVLQMDCQKMEGNYFLWGLFHRIGKKDKVANIEFVDKGIDISGKDNEEVVAMEIDMTGGGAERG
ncbi:uncharacterized protein LOC116010493 [Ipomoea triloba]|uniref:uncharacterized protein LOC116010493 n=1 Tax=Ipomoea triloba TaxID=35885 RepID=UPI00125D5B3E|nr:uncharacterized protein LOC116010493 [Ipomoea triloba]